jgi:thiamine kinase-like enzyme
MNEKSLMEKKIKDLYPNKTVKLLAEGGMSFACEAGDNIIRVPKNEYAAIGYRIEEKILVYLQNKVKSVEIPSVKIIKEPFFYTIHKKLEGLYWDRKTYIKKTEREKDALANDCAVFLATIHASDTNEINSLLHEENLELREIRPIEDNLKKYLPQYFSTDEIDKIIKFTNGLFSLPDENKCLVHNDFFHDNFFVDDSFRLKCVIDFGNSGRYNYNFDLRKVVSYEEGESDFWGRIVRYYEGMTNRKIDMEIIKMIDIHNYISFLVYFAKYPEIKEEKIGVRDKWDSHIEHVKDKLRKYKVV